MSAVTVKRGDVVDVHSHGTVPDGDRYRLVDIWTPATVVRVLADGKLKVRKHGEKLPRTVQKHSWMKPYLNEGG